MKMNTIFYVKFKLSNPFLKYSYFHKVLCLVAKYSTMLHHDNIKIFEYLECAGQCKHVLSYYSIEYSGCFL